MLGRSGISTFDVTLLGPVGAVEGGRVSGKQAAISLTPKGRPVASASRCFATVRK